MAESILWNVVRRRQLEGAKFRRQHPLGQFVVDFFCPEAALVVELDGDVHERQDVAEADRQRDRSLRALGLRVLRFANAEVYTELERVVDTIGESILEHRRRRGVGG